MIDEKIGTNESVSTATDKHNFEKSCVILVRIYLASGEYVFKPTCKWV